MTAVESKGNSETTGRLPGSACSLTDKPGLAVALEAEIQFTVNGGRDEPKPG